MRHILKCGKCGSYTMSEKCGCGSKAVTTKPPKYSPDDRFKEYRRKAKREILEGEGLL